MTAWPDMYLEATKTAKERVDRVVEGLPRAEEAVGPTLEDTQVVQMFDTHIKPLIMAGQTDKVLEWIYRYAPPGTDAGKELGKLIRRVDRARGK